MAKREPQERTCNCNDRGEIATRPETVLGGLVQGQVQESGSGVRVRSQGQGQGSGSGVIRALKLITFEENFQCLLWWQGQGSEVRGQGQGSGSGSGLDSS